MVIPVKMNVPVRFLGLIISLLLAAASFAQTTFVVSGTFSDNSSTPFTGIVNINTQTGAIVGFNFNIPTMTLGATTLPGANFTPSTATANFFSSNAPPCSPAQGGFMTFQLFNAPPNSEELYLLIPQSSLISYNGGALLQQVTCGGQAFHTGYQSGLQSNPFFEISGNGSITTPQLQASGSVRIPVNPLATFLATSANDTSAVPATPISLASLNIHPGDTIILSALGDVSFCLPSNCPEVKIPLDGLFSATNSSSGAIAAAGNPIPFVTPPTLFGGIPTDIPQDFRIPHAPNYTAVTVPAGAQSLFLIMVDTYYSDNADPNNDLGVLITSPTGPVYVSDSTQVIKVDPNTGAISVVLTSGAGASEDIAIGPDGKVYICDATNGRILRMNQDGSQFEAIYNFSTTTSTTCGGSACPESVDGLSFVLSSGDLFFITVADDHPGPFTGAWEIPGVAGIGFGGPFPLPVNILPASQLLGTQEGQGTAFDLSRNWLMADASLNRILSSPPPYTSASVLIPDTMGVNPVGVAVNSHGDILVANLGSGDNAGGNVACFSSSGSFQTLYTDFSSSNDLPLYIKFDSSGNLFVATSDFTTDPVDGRLWRVSPAASPPCSAPGIRTLVADIGAAFSSSSVPGLNDSVAVGVAIPNLSAPPTPLTSGGQPITGTPITVFSSPTAVEQVTFPPGTVIPPGETMQATASTLTTTDFQNARTAGSVFFEQNPNTKCILYPNTPTTSNGTCFVFEDKCFDASGNPTTCPTSPQPNIIVSTTINNLPTTPPGLEPLPVNPGFLTADDNQNDWVNIFLDMYVFQSTAAAAPVLAAARTAAGARTSLAVQPLPVAPTLTLTRAVTPSDPAPGDPLVIRGGTTGFNSDFVAVDIGPDPLVGAGTFQGFQPPLAPRNARAFTRGTTIPVKFQVVSATNASQFITNATAKLTVVLQANPPVQEMVGAANNKGTDAQFVYIAKSNSYQYYLSTVDYPAGSYTLTVFSNSFPAQVVTFTLR